MGDFRALKVWSAARELTSLVYQATASFPSEERYGLSSQMRRAAVSIMCNIAEGCGRNRRREFAYHLRVAAGSATELDCQLVVAVDQRILDESAAAKLQGRVTEVQKMLAGLHRHLIAHS